MATLINTSLWNIVLIASVLWTLCSVSRVTNALSYGETCTRSAYSNSCSSPNLTCSDNSTCVCSPDYVIYYCSPDDVACVKKPDYGEACNTENVDSCLDTTTVCIPDVNGTSRCICDDSYYRNLDDTCRELRELRVDKLTTNSNTSTVILSWVTYSLGVNVNYEITSNEGQGYLEGSVTSAGATWANLTAGRKYSFTITSIVSTDSFYPRGTKRVPVTKESQKPGPVVSYSYISGAPGIDYVYDVTFQPSQGDVASYSMIINNETVNGSTATNYYFYTLVPGQSCTYFITAYNGIGRPSEASIGIFRINTTNPGVIRALKIEQNGQDVTISFLCPDGKAFPGNIQGYRIEKILFSINGSKEQNTSYAVLPSSPTSCKSTYSASQVGGILVDRAYNFSVRAWNEYYVGDYSAPIYFYAFPEVYITDDKNSLALALGLGLGLGFTLVVIVVVIYIRCCRRRNSHPYNQPEDKFLYKHVYWVPDGNRPNLSPHHPQENPPYGDGYLVPEVPPYFTTPELNGSTHAYTPPDEAVYNTIDDVYIYPEGVPKNI